MTSIEDRLRETDDLHFRVARQDLKLPYQVNLGVVTSTVQGPLYEAILRQLGDKSLRLSEILAAKDLSGTSPADLARAVDAAVAMGMMDVTAGAVVKAGQLTDKSGKVRLPSRFNATMLKSESLGGRPVALASEVSGTGHSVGDFDAAILQELAENGRDGLARRVEERLAGSGRSLQQNGQPVNDPKMRGELVEGACEAFMSTSLPQLATLGIVEFS